jgi:hypothetical protein
VLVDILDGSRTQVWTAFDLDTVKLLMTLFVSFGVTFF